jgi:hypothetical protein
MELFSTPQGDAYATVMVNEHFENYRLDSKDFRKWARYQFYEKTGKSPRPQAITDAVSQFDAAASYRGAVKPVSIRIAKAGDTHFLDLADDSWRVVKFGPEGWGIVDKPPVKFRRPPGMLPLPAPVSGGDINELRGFLNLPDDEAWVLFLADLLQALIATGPYPILIFHGEAGSGKTTQGRVFRAIVDPNVSPSRAVPKDQRDLMITATNGWALAFDNLSYIPVWLSDALCRLSTGGGLATRELYTNSDEVIFDAQRPVILNGVEELATRTDLIDRAIQIELPPIKTYRDEARFWGDLENARPRLLGALLDLAVKALRKVGTIKLADKPRMADFAALATAAEGGLGLRRGTFLTAYTRNRNFANAVALEASPLATPIVSLVKKEEWAGTASELLRKLGEIAGEDVLNRNSWPKNAKSLSGMLRRLVPALRTASIEVRSWRASNDERTRMISISRQKVAKDDRSSSAKSGKR